MGEVVFLRRPAEVVEIPIREIEVREAPADMMRRLATMAMDTYRSRPDDGVDELGVTKKGWLNFAHILYGAAVELEK